MTAIDYISGQVLRMYVYMNYLSSERIELARMNLNQN